MKNFIVLVVILLIATFGVYIIDKNLSTKTANAIDIQKFIDSLKF